MKEEVNFKYPLCHCQSLSRFPKQPEVRKGCTRRREKASYTASRQPFSYSLQQLPEFPVWETAKKSQLSMKIDCRLIYYSHIHVHIAEFILCTCKKMTIGPTQVFIQGDHHEIKFQLLMENKNKDFKITSHEPFLVNVSVTYIQVIKIISVNSKNVFV